MNDKNELNDIILNKGNATNSNKKIILAVATLGIILIIVVMLMNSLSSNGTDNLPKAVLPPEPQQQVAQDNTDEPLFEDVDVVEEKTSSDADLDKIAKKLKQESLKEDLAVEEVATPAPKPEVKKVVKHTVKKQPVANVAQVQASNSIVYYIQVGSFSRYEPNKKFLNSITSLGYKYKYHKVGNTNKVLVGPFKNSNDAKKARHILRSKVEPGAFLVKL